MRKIPIVFLQTVVVAMGIGVLALMLWQPHLEGRNATATVFQVYFNDPFLAYAYVASIAFFIGLFQAFKLLGYARRDEIFSQRSVKALRTIQYCALSLVCFIVGAEAYFSLSMSGEDDIAGGVMMGLVMILLSVVVAATAAVLERSLQAAIDSRSN